MNFCRTSLVSIKKLMRSLADADMSVSAELRQIAATGINSGSTVVQTSSSTVMALGQLGLLDRTEAGSNLSV